MRKPGWIGGIAMSLGGCAIALGLVGCTKSFYAAFDAPLTLGGQTVAPERLNLGRATYLNNCMQCHGVQGDGAGPAARGMNPPPRDFRQGLFKFGSVASGELPTDGDLKLTIRQGLRGTAMLPWDLSEEQLDAVVQYLKTFAPVWREQSPGMPQAISPDPFKGDPARAVALGKKVYHGLAQCYACHPSYAALPEIDAAARELTQNGVSSLRPHPELSLLLDSSYGHKLSPPDFTKSAIKTGGDVESLYRVLGTGVGGTSMPAWKGLLAEDRLWALAYYVNSLHRLRDDSPARQKFFTDLNARRARDRRP